jgi:hypothetical protein
MRGRAGARRVFGSGSMAVVEWCGKGFRVRHMTRCTPDDEEGAGDGAIEL